MNQIKWSSWNIIEDELVQKSSQSEKPTEIVGEDKVLELIPMGGMKPTIQTPFGEVSTDNPLRPANLWQCWMAATNFRITHEIVDLLLKIDGISVIKVLDRYSFCIGIGELFNATMVKSKITSILCPNNEPGEGVLNAFYDVKKKIDDTKEWCVYIKDDGSHLIYNGDSKEDCLHFVRAFEVMKKQEGGFIFLKEE